MGPSKTVRTISQEAFEEMVQENIEDLGMDPAEALEDAIQTLTLQGVDLSGIVTCLGGKKDNSVIQCLDTLKSFNSDSKGQIKEKDADEVLELLEKLCNLCSIEESGNAAVAVRNGGLELLCSLCSKLNSGLANAFNFGFKTMTALLLDVQSTAIFEKSNGPKVVVDILKNSCENADVLNDGFAVVAAAATGNEIVKQSFMELKIDELILQIFKGKTKGSIHSIFDAIRILLTPDDNRVVASQVYGYARSFAKIGIAGALVDSLDEGITSPSLVSGSIALKAVAVNDEICKSIAENGGIDAVLRCIDDSGAQHNQTTAIACCSLLSKLAGSDANKSTIVEKRGMDRLIILSARFSDNPSVVQEVMSVFWVLCLRSPQNASLAIEAGAGDLAIQAMEKFPTSLQLQKNSCLMIRNLVVRNRENRTLLLNNGIEKLIRKAKENHVVCKNAAVDALRDLGLDNYNSE